VKGAPPVAAPGLYAKLVLVAAIWGGQYSAGRLVAEALPWFTNSALRFVVATAILVPLAYARDGGLPRLDGRRFATMLALGFSGVFVFNVCFFAGLERVPAGRGALIMALNPVMTALGAWLVFGERMRRVRVLGIVLAVAGVIVVITRGDLGALANGALGLGELLLFGSVLGWVVYTLMGRAVLKGMSPLGATTWASLLGMIMLVACAVFERPWAALAALPPSGWGAIAYLGALGTVVAFLWFYQGVQRIGPARAAVFLSFVPVFGVVIAALVLGEPILASMIVGGAMVVGGVLLTNRPEPQSARLPRADHAADATRGTGAS
jgi:drug/metabolite transporter (DMT)-like permease